MTKRKCFITIALETTQSSTTWASITCNSCSQSMKICKLWFACWAAARIFYLRVYYLSLVPYFEKGNYYEGKISNIFFEEIQFRPNLQVVNVLSSGRILCVFVIVIINESVIWGIVNVEPFLWKRINVSMTFDSPADL